MARKPEEEYEEEEYEEEEEEIDLDAETINMIKHQILDAMKNYKPESPEYGILMQRLSDLGSYERDLAQKKRDETDTIRIGKETEQLENQKYAWFLPTLFQTGANCLTNIGIEVFKTSMNRRNLKTVVGYEDSGEIINSKGLGFVKKQ